MRKQIENADVSEQALLMDEIMKEDETQADDLRPEYEFSTMEGGVRGKYV